MSRHTVLSAYNAKLLAEKMHGGTVKTRVTKRGCELWSADGWLLGRGKTWDAAVADMTADPFEGKDKS